MKEFLFSRLEKSNAGTDCRNGLRDFIFDHPEHLKDLIAFGTDLKNKNHHKAVWIIEMVAEVKTGILLPHIDSICETISAYKNDSAIRGMSRVAFFLGTSKNITLTEFQKEKLIEICLDWLIRDERVACKVYAMKTLVHFGKKEPWINEELKEILGRDYVWQSAGYKAAAREVLGRIK
ncbi:hypothetical protein FEDK69T_20570 [Flavobacterium enshiense DK69]|uniref:Adenylosuccinate lyase n=1 Tax=Flavobacterium enshiense DK69 TaxID=1107311 RepID=V6S730_9FLAO|nr:hypothetical protein [Flavobacterium enshiense]ESU22082.1 hypothetical protein FEDK69T_20570 [Flavobacterium enshiense DK69]KGO97097.1 hypothetical protein Q767_00395 [Flavobacterium enshiense DK69]